MKDANAKDDDRRRMTDVYISFPHNSQGVATLAAAKPSFAAYGDSANVFGGISNPTGARDTIFSRWIAFFVWGRIVDERMSDLCIRREMWRVDVHRS
jgi:hypothetical protein